VKLKLVIGLYLGFWIGLGILLVPQAAKVGVPAWATAGTVLAVFVLVNGSLAYLVHSRELRRKGQTPPPYLNYLFQTQNINEPIPIPTLVRVALGLVVFLGAALFVFVGGVLVFAAKGTGEFIGGSILLSLGLIFSYVGYRVIRMNRPGRRLFGADREHPLPNSAAQSDAFRSALNAPPPSAPGRERYASEKPAA
jgi:hypothetical protein